jgi:hypothetical protein
VSCVYCSEAILIHDEGISKNGKQNPKFKENIVLFNDSYGIKHYNDLEFYLGNINHMKYKYKG